MKKANIKSTKIKNLQFEVNGVRLTLKELAMLLGDDGSLPVIVHGSGSS